MTLFKKVFGDHAVGDQSDPAWPAQNDGFEFDDTYEDVIADRIAAVAAKTAADGSAVDVAAENASPEAPQEHAPAGEENLEETLAQITSPPEAPAAAEVKAEMTMAERAALAQQQIAQSQNRQSSEQTRPPAPATPEMGAAPAPVSNPAPTPRPEVVPAPVEAARPVPAPAHDQAPEPEATQAEAPIPAPVSEPAPTPAPRPGRAARRVRTRLLGFDQGGEDTVDPFDKAASGEEAAPQIFPVGWLVIADGPGRGHSFAIFNGASTIGRGDDQAIKLDFGDNSISRQNHAAIAYDDEQNKFYLGHGGKSNIIRLNDRPVLSTEELTNGDVVRIGETTLRFVALCGADFNWGTPSHDEG